MKPTLRIFPLLPLLLVLPGCGMPAGMEWFIIGGVALLLFGGAKLPGLMRSMGSGINEFKRGLKDGEGEDDAAASGEGDPPKKELEASQE